VTAPALLPAAVGIGLVLRATLLIAAAWAAAALLRRAGAAAAARHTAWLLGIAALLALPLIWWLAPPLKLPILRPEAAPVAAAALAPPAGAALPPPAGGPAWGQLLLAVYLGGAAILLLRFLMGRRLIARLWREAEPAQGAAWRDLLADAAREIGLHRPVALRLARGAAMPMTWGTLAPRILLPAEAHDWPAERRRLVLLHELAHVARCDSFSRSAAALACALYWFHPGAWLAARRLRLEQEYAADDRVLNAGAPARRYALSLIELARRVGERPRPDHAAAMAGMCQLERRVLAITSPTRRGRPGPAFLSAAGAIATFVMLAVAAGVPVRPSPASPDPPAIATEVPRPRTVRAPSEDQAGPEALMPARAAASLRADGDPRPASGGFEARPAIPAPAQAEMPSQGTEVGRIERAPPAGAAAPAAGATAGLIGQEAPAAAPPLRVYGPPAPQPIAAEQESDPRIPAALRRGNAGRGAEPGREGDQDGRQAPPRSRAGTRIWPRLLLSPAQAFP
jgi:beta-lactamase regulating signal transducer with metallopeptidase domain